jgi:hypothetical protein
MNNEYLNKLLFSMLGSESLVSLWWNTANKAFQNRCPKDVDTQQVTAYLEGHAFR